jgi:hypothetical protein
VTARPLFAQLVRKSAGNPVIEAIEQGKSLHRPVDQQAPEPLIDRITVIRIDRLQKRSKFGAIRITVGEREIFGVNIPGNVPAQNDSRLLLGVEHTFRISVSGI